MGLSYYCIKCTRVLFAVTARVEFWFWGEADELS